MFCYYNSTIKWEYCSYFENFLIQNISSLKKMYKRCLCKCTHSAFRHNLFCITELSVSYIPWVLYRHKVVEQPYYCLKENLSKYFLSMFHLNPLSWVTRNAFHVWYFPHSSHANNNLENGVSVAIISDHSIGHWLMYILGYFIYLPKWGF